jgi:hypothetical protein
MDGHVDYLARLLGRRYLSDLSRRIVVVVPRLVEVHPASARAAGHEGSGRAVATAVDRADT